jgi:hypothetical protein
MEHHILYSIFDSTENENLSVQFKNKRSIIFFIQFLTQLKTKISQYNLKIKEEGRKKKASRSAARKRNERNLAHRNKTAQINLISSRFINVFLEIFLSPNL